jgi:uncharacterized protein YkwD
MLPYLIAAAFAAVSVFSAAQPALAQSQSSAQSTDQIIENAVLLDINAARAQQALPLFAQDASLAQLASEHSADMLQHGTFSHDDASGCSPTCRLSDAGFPWQAMGENIYELTGDTLSPQETAHEIVAGWLADPEHRQNLLDTSFTEVGIGVAADGTTVYATADFARTQ